VFQQCGAFLFLRFVPLLQSVDSAAALSAFMNEPEKRRWFLYLLKFMAPLSPLKVRWRQSSFSAWKDWSVVQALDLKYIYTIADRYRAHW